MSAAETRSRVRAVAESGAWLLAKGIAIRRDNGGGGLLMVVGCGEMTSRGLGVVEGDITLQRTWEPLIRVDMDEPTKRARTCSTQTGTNGGIR